MLQSSQFDGVAFVPEGWSGLCRSRRRPVSGSVGFHGNACDCSARRSTRSGLRDHRANSVLEQNAVLERLVPALDLALGLRMARGAANMRDATVLQPFRKIARDVARSVIAEQSWFVHDLGAVAA